MYLRCHYAFADWAVTHWPINGITELVELVINLKTAKAKPPAAS